jgi:hypothetical protein
MPLTDCVIVKGAPVTFVGVTRDVLKWMIVPVSM